MNDVILAYINLMDDTTQMLRRAWRVDAALVIFLFVCMLGHILTQSESGVVSILVGMIFVKLLVGGQPRQIYIVDTDALNSLKREIARAN